MRKKDDQSPATKKDLRELETRMEGGMQDMETRLVDHFNVVAENLVHDFKGVFKDRLEQHENRIHRSERHVGIEVA